MAKEDYKDAIDGAEDSGNQQYEDSEDSAHKSAGVGQTCYGSWGMKVVSV